MNPCKRTVLAVVLLTCISMPLLFLAYWRVQQVIVRYEMIEKLEKVQLLTLRLPTRSVQWFEKDKELIIDGKLFDVKSYFITGDSATFSGLFDDQESDIKKQIDFLQQPQNDTEAAKGAAIKFIFFPVTGEQGNGSLNHPVIICGMPPTPVNASKIPVIVLSLPYPPPKAYSFSLLKTPAYCNKC
jgi:hypothetical protein